MFVCHVYYVCIYAHASHTWYILFLLNAPEDVRGLSFAVSLMVLLPPPPYDTLHAHIRTSACLSQTAAKNRHTSLFWRKLRFSRPGTKRLPETDGLIFSVPVLFDVSPRIHILHDGFKMYEHDVSNTKFLILYHENLTVFFSIE